MTSSLPLSPARHLVLAPTFFIGIDVGKKFHVAGFISASLLGRKRFEQCPVLRFEQSRAGITKLLENVRAYAKPEQCVVVVENTGHYHRALVEFLVEEGFRVYIVAIRRKRVNGQNKTDSYDALRLANMLYAQLALGLQLDEKSQQIREFAPPTEASAQLQGLIRRRYEITQAITRTKNKLTAICDEIFPEFTEVFRDPNALIALAFRSRFPTPVLLSQSTVDELRTVKQGSGSPSRQKLEKLLLLANKSIGVTKSSRVASLVFEQDQLIESIRLLRVQIDALDNKIETIVRASREGKILLSFPMMGVIHAGTILAAMGNIRNFASMAELRKFCGWAPQSTQTGTTLDRSNMTPTGSRLLRQVLFLLTMSVISKPETVWSKLYHRLVPMKCSFDSRTGTYKGRMRVVGRVAGQMVGVIYILLKQDADLVDRLLLSGQQSLPEPDLYDPEVHAGTKPKSKPVPTLAVSPLPLTTPLNSGMMA